MGVAGCEATLGSRTLWCFPSFGVFFGISGDGPCRTSGHDSFHCHHFRGTSVEGLAMDSSIQGTELTTSRGCAKVLMHYLCRGLGDGENNLISRNSSIGAT